MRAAEQRWRFTLHNRQLTAVVVALETRRSDWSYLGIQAVRIFHDLSHQEPRHCSWRWRRRAQEPGMGDSTAGPGLPAAPQTGRQTTKKTIQPQVSRSRTGPLQSAGRPTIAPPRPHAQPTRPRKAGLYGPNRPLVSELSFGQYAPPGRHRSGKAHSTSRFSAPLSRTSPSHQQVSLTFVRHRAEGNHLGSDLPARSATWSPTSRA